ncbi:MAG: ABC transporter ATP-binding protein [Gammaproteobacteria bacterium]|nr:ABC transporter ATP-binding protein [Gammaproteobacteria bacterium]
MEPDRHLDPPAPRLPDTPLAFVLHFVRLYWPAVLAVGVLECGQSSSAIMLPYAIKQIMDAVTAAQNTGADVWSMLEAPLTLFALLNVGLVVFSRGSGTILVMLGPALRRRIRRQLFAYLQHHSQRYFLSNFAGSLANRIAETSMSTAQVLWTVMFDFLPLAITCSVSLVLLTRVNPNLALILAVWIAFYVLVSFALALRCRRYAREYAAARSLVSGKIVDSVTNIMNSKLFARRDFEREYLEHYLNIEVKRARRTFWFMEGIRWFQFIAAACLMVGIVYYAVQLWAGGGMTPGEFAMSASLCLLLIEQARGLSRKFLEFFEYIGNVNDGVSVIIRPHEVIDRKQATALAITQGRIRIENLQFSYVPHRAVFSNLMLEIPPGQKLGLVGFSGSGKSTLLNLILRLFEPQGGRILIDGQDTQAVTQESLRAAIAMIPQDPMLFHRSLIDNVRYGRLDATDDEVIAAAHRAHAHEFILQTEEQYQSLVGERGVKLSGGQRQRIALARAILKDSPILLLDEATSSLDSVTEHYIQESLADLMKNKTVVVIAHRLSTLAHLDRIVVFHEGRIVEDGSHVELLAREGHYARMWAMQAGGFLPEDEVPLTLKDEILEEDLV